MSSDNYAMIWPWNLTLSIFNVSGQMIGIWLCYGLYSIKVALFEKQKPRYFPGLFG